MNEDDSAHGQLPSRSRKLLATLSDTFPTEDICKIPIDLTDILGNAYDGLAQPLAYLLENVLTPQECLALISLAEEIGYDPAFVTIGDSGYKIKSPDFRNNYQTVFKEQEFADALWDRVSCFIPATLQERPVTGFSPDLRFIRYDPGEKFGPHRDGTKRTKNKNGSWLGGDVSMLTLQFYLNDGFEGGETSFLSWNKEKRIDVVPKAGAVLVFDHSLLHQGSLLRSGRKYSFITDAMYKEVELQNDESLDTRAEAGRSNFWKQNCSVM